MRGAPCQLVSPHILHVISFEHLRSTYLAFKWPCTRNIAPLLYSVNTCYDTIRSDWYNNEPMFLNQKDEPVKSLKIGNNVFKWGSRTYVMGILNVSPDSFSGDGLASLETIVQQAKRMEADGADIIDIGGESTRPNYTPVSLQEEKDRVIPAVQAISKAIDIPVSVDTMKYEVALAAVEAGADMLNDQWGLLKEPGIARIAADNKLPVIVMSNQREKGGYDASAQRDTASYRDVMKEVIASLKQSVSVALSAGIPTESIIVDPGIGFGKTWQQDIEVLRKLAELKCLDCPILIGTSRKSLIKMVLGLPADERVEGTAATVAISINNGADIVRVHDVKEIARVCKMTDAIVRGV